MTKQTVFCSRPANCYLHINKSLITFECKVSNKNANKSQTHYSVVVKSEQMAIHKEICCLLLAVLENEKKLTSKCRKAC